MSGAIEIEIDQDRGLTIFTVSGDFTGEQVMQVIQEFYDGDPTDRVLWDLSTASFEHISGTVPQQLAGVSQQHIGPDRKGGMTALVFASDVGFGLGRMFETFRSLQGSDVTYGTFRSRKKALAWLDTDLDE